jgi:hypothetical protein
LKPLHKDDVNLFESVRGDEVETEMDAAVLVTSEGRELRGQQNVMYRRGKGDRPVVRV